MVRRGACGGPGRLDRFREEQAMAGTRLKVDYRQTVSCYQADADGKACGRCDACRLRRAGFIAAGVPDPTRYQDV